MSERESGSGVFLAGFLVGAAAGIGAALVTAPRSGEETIAALRGRGQALKSRAAELRAQTRERAGDQFHRLQEGASDRFANWEAHDRDAFEQTQITLHTMTERHEEAVDEAVTAMAEEVVDDMATTMAEVEARQELADDLVEEVNIEDRVEMVDAAGADELSTEPPADDVSEEGEGRAVA